MENLKTCIENEINKINHLYDKAVSSLINAFKLEHERLFKEENDIKEKLQNEVTKIKEELVNNLSFINTLLNLSTKINKGYKTYNNEITKLNYISKVNIIIKELKKLFIKSIKSFEFNFEKDKNDIIYNEYYINEIFIPSNIQFKEITLSSVNIYWNRDDIKYKNIDDINKVKYIIEKKENNKEYKKLYEGNNNFFELKDISLNDSFEFRICSIYNDLISPWSKSIKLNLCEINHLNFIERLNNKNGLLLYRDGIYNYNDGEFFILKKGDIQYGPYRLYKQGKYLIIYYGQNLLKADLDVIDNSFQEKFNFKILKQSDDKIYYEVDINKKLVSGVEFRSFNNKENALILIKYIDVFMYTN